jgi:hypothetical protein
MNRQLEGFEISAKTQQLLQRICSKFAELFMGYNKKVASCVGRIYK